MNRTKLATRLLMLGTAVLAMSVQGCQATPTEPVMIDGLLSHLNIALASTTAAGSASRANAIPPGFVNPPLDSEIQTLGPNTNIFRASWPVIDDLRITGEWIGDEIRLHWPAINPAIWPTLDVAGGMRYGNEWFIYPDGGDPTHFVAQHGEWLREPGETTGTVYDLISKLLADPPCSNCPVGHLLAGPSRHVSDSAEFRRRSEVYWFRWGDMSPFTWPGSGTPVPTGPPALTELHLFITGATVVLAGGSTLTFDDPIGDVELFALNGMPHQIANSPVLQGEFASISFVVDPTQSWVRAGGEVATLNFGDPTIVVQGPWTVGSGNFTTVTLTIDIDASTTWNPADGSWTFAPVIMITVTTG